MSLTETRQIPFGRPWIVEEDRQAVLNVLNGHILTHGPECRAFEAEFSAFLGPDAHAVSVSSCMAALHLAALHFGFGPGDEVIVPAQTHTATVHAIEWVGARPVFVDCDPATGNLTADRVAAAITPKTRGVVVVHFVGIPCEMPAIASLAERGGLTLIEDCALAVGARWDGRHVGLFGDAGCFSFYPVKHITTGEGGMFVSRHRAVVETVARLRAFGVDRTHTERAVPGMYDVPALGMNYRMSEMQAALGRVQIRRLPENLAHRQRTFERMAAGIRDIAGLGLLDATDAKGPNSHYCLSVVLPPSLAEHRPAIVKQLNERGVGTSVYYPHPVPRLAYYRNKYGYDAGRYPNAATISDHSFALPVSWHIGPDDADYIVESLGEVVDSARGKS